VSSFSSCVVSLVAQLERIRLDGERAAQLGYGLMYGRQKSGPMACASAHTLKEARDRQIRIITEQPFYSYSKVRY
jgi:hypothetical protein